MNKEREFVGGGTEHRVYRSLVDPQEVIKTPTLWMKISLFLAGLTAYSIRDELNDAKKIVGESQAAKIPETHIYIIKRGRDWRGKLSQIFPSYVIRQQYIREDRSIEDIEQHLRTAQLNHLADTFYLTPWNFQTENKIVYWVDTTKGLAARIYRRYNLLPYEDYTRLRAQAKKVLVKFLPFWDPKRR